MIWGYRRLPVFNEYRVHTVTDHKVPKILGPECRGFWDKESGDTGDLEIKFKHIFWKADSVGHMGLGV